MNRRFAALAALAACGCSTAIEGRSSFVAPGSVLEVRWTRHLTSDNLLQRGALEYKPQEFAAAAGDGERVFVGSSAGVFYAFDARDGGVLWSRSLEGGVAARPRYRREDGVVFIGTKGGQLYALDAATGAVRWQYGIKGPIESQPTWADGIVYFTSGENRVYAVDARSGAWKWQYDRESPDSFTIRGYAAPLVVGSRVYAGFSDGYLACLAAGTGDVLWARSLAGEATRFMDVDSTPVVDGGTLYVTSYSGGVYALEPKDGSVKWRFDVEGAGTVRVRDGRVYFAAAKSGLHALDTDGHLLWRQALAAGGELSPPLVVGNYVMVAASQAGVYVADAVSGRLYQFFSPGHGVTAEPTSDGRQVYFMSNGGYFYALRFRS
ncbi:MAG TPA: PQQ-binding-like beta-propeller repeat protein [Polyangia bacterium]|nr:PQQ-binding-like beta-propeller repeat protein [Polyangia bacterium]